MLFIY